MHFARNAVALALVGLTQLSNAQPITGLDQIRDVPCGQGTFLENWKSCLHPDPITDAVRLALFVACSVEEAVQNPSDTKPPQSCVKLAIMIAKDMDKDIPPEVGATLYDLLTENKGGLEKRADPGHQDLMCELLCNDARCLPPYTILPIKSCKRCRMKAKGSYKVCGGEAGSPPGSGP